MVLSAALQATGARLSSISGAPVAQGETKTGHLDSQSVFVKKLFSFPPFPEYLN